MRKQTDDFLQSCKKPRLLECCSDEETHWSISAELAEPYWRHPFQTKAVMIDPYYRSQFFFLNIEI